MINPDEIYINNPRKKSIAKYDDVCVHMGTIAPEYTSIINLCKILGETGETVNYIELGVWYGGTFNKVLTDCKHIKINAIGIDLFEDFEIINDGNTHYGDVANIKDITEKLTNNGHTNFKLIKGDTVKNINELPKMKNVVCFIDANHTYEAVKADFNAIRNKMENGFIILDDLNWISIRKFFDEIRFSYKIYQEHTRFAVIEIPKTI